MQTQLKRSWLPLGIVLIAGLLLSGCVGVAFAVGQSQFEENQSTRLQSEAQSAALTANQEASASQLGEPTVSFTLKTGLVYEKMSFTGVGGEIDGQVNPDLLVQPGDVVEIILLNDDGVQHNLTVEGSDVQTEDIQVRGQQVRVVFSADEEGTFTYYCGIPGHREAGMEGRLIVGQPSEALMENLPDISRPPTDLPSPLRREPSQDVEIDLETIEIEARLADGTSYRYWTFNGKIPGPFFRVQVGDTIQVNFKNSPDSTMVHSVDFHAVTGPGGGAVATQTQPGEETSFTFRALKPGLFVYHCATPMVAQHIANGMYGMILVEPEGGLPPVDREFYVMQGEIYTTQPYGQTGATDFNIQKMLDEAPEYLVFNGSVGALTANHPLEAKVGETVRIFFGVGGPNYTSSFHVIGEIFDRAYPFASLTSPPLTDVQTIMVPTGGATMVEFTLEVPGRYILVDHSLARLERGLAGFLFAEGDDAPEIFDYTPPEGSGN